MKKRWIQQIFRQFLIAVVIFSFILPGNLWAKRKGARVQVTKLDGQVVEGRLLKVKENSLIIMTSSNGVTIDIREVDRIRVRKKSNFWRGFLIGESIGFGGAALFGAIMGSRPGEDSIGTFRGALIAGIIFGPICGLIGGLSGGLLGTGISSRDKTYQVKGKLPSQIKKILRSLRKRALFKY